MELWGGRNKETEFYEEVPGKPWPKNGPHSLRRKSGCHLFYKIAYKNLTVRVLIHNNKLNAFSQDTPITCTLYKTQGAVSCLRVYVIAAYHHMLFVLWLT